MFQINHKKGKQMKMPTFNSSSREITIKNIVKKTSNIVRLDNVIIPQSNNSVLKITKFNAMENEMGTILIELTTKRTFVFLLIDQIEPS